MKLFMAGMNTETNTFSPLPTGAQSYQEGGVHHGDASRQPVQYWTSPFHKWREMGEAKGWEVIESLSAQAQPAGLTVRTVHEAFRAEILADLRAAMPVDVILLSMHGAMAADGCDDCEGDLIVRCREIAPDATIATLLDPHCHLTEKMLDNATLLVAYKEYPHVDIPERAEDLFRLAADAAEGITRPVMRDFDCRMIYFYATTAQPMRGFVDAMSAREGHDGVLSLSLAHGFPWGDHPRVGTRALAICDGDAGAAEAEAKRLGLAFFELRNALKMDLPDINAALDTAQDLAQDLTQGEPKGPVVLADMSDNAGGGAPSDATFLLREIVRRGMKSVVSGLYWDPVAVRICCEAGIGAVIPLRLGGKCGPMSGDPLDLVVTVRQIGHDLSQLFGRLPTPMGTCVWLECDGIDIVINDNRTQVFHPQAFEKLGIDLSARRYVVVKSSNHYQAGFNPIATRVIPVATPGAINPDFTAIPYTRRARDYWPAIEEPFS